MIKEPTTIFWAHEGPKLSWHLDTLHIEDLNPELSVKWNVTAAELEQIGRRCIQLAEDAIFAAARGSRQ